MLSIFVKSYTALQARAERGAGMAEYVLLLALVAALMVTAFSGLVNAMTDQLSNIATKVSN